MSKVPTLESISMCVAMHKREDGVSGKCRYSEKDKTVYLLDSPIITVINHKDDGGWELSVNLCGWGDTSTTRAHINSILMRLLLPFRVGQFKRKRYMYRIEKDGALTPWFEMPNTGGVVIPTGLHPTPPQERE